MWVKYEMDSNLIKVCKRIREIGKDNLISKYKKR